MPESEVDYEASSETEVIDQNTSTRKDELTRKMRANPHDQNEETKTQHIKSTVLVPWEEIALCEKPLWKLKWGRTAHNKAETKAIQLLINRTGLSKERIKKHIYTERENMLQLMKLSAESLLYPKGPPGWMMPFNPDLKEPEKPKNFAKLKIDDERRHLQHQHSLKLLTNDEYTKMLDCLRCEEQELVLPNKKENKDTNLNNTSANDFLEQGKRSVQYYTKLGKGSVLTRLNRDKRPLSPTLTTSGVSPNTRVKVANNEMVVDTRVTRTLSPETIRNFEAPPLTTTNSTNIYGFGRGLSAREISQHQSVQWEDYVLSKVQRGELQQLFAAVSFESAGDVRIPLNLSATNYNKPTVVPLEVALRMQEDYIRSLYRHSDEYTRRDLLQQHHWLGAGFPEYHDACRSQLFPFLTKMKTLH